MPSSSTRSSVKRVGAQRLHLPLSSVPHQHGLLHGREISVYCGQQRPSSWVEHSYSQAKIAVLFEPVVGLYSWRTAAGQFREQRLTGRQVLGVLPGQRHAWQWELAGELMLIFLEPSFLRRVPQKNWRRILTGTPLPFHGSDPVFWQLSSVLRLLCLEKGEPAAVVIEAAARTLALRFFALDKTSLATPDGQILTPERKQRVLDFIQQNFANPDLRVAQLAKLVSLSPPHFSEIFRHTLGRPPMEHVRRCRLIHAHQLVQTRNFRMGEIADACGFYDVSHLGREFRAYYKYPPRLLLARTGPAGDRSAAE